MRKWYVSSGSPAKEMITLGIAGFEEGKTRAFSHGILSPGWYVDCRRLPSHPQFRKKVILQLQELYRPEYGETIASVELGGVVPATELASSFGLPHVIVRKRAKAHGRGGIIAGDLAVVEGEHVLVVEDTGTTLQSVEDAVRTLRKHGAIVTDVFLLVSYQFPELLAKAEELKIRLHHVFSVDLLITMAMLMDRIDPKYRELLWAWLEDPRAPWEWPK